MSIRLAVMAATIIATATASEMSTGSEPAAASIHGTVRNEGGAPVPLAHVALQPGAATAITDSGGRYRISGVASGSYQIRVVHPAFAPAVSRIVVRGDESISRNFTLIAVTPRSRDEVSARGRQEAEHGYVRELPVAPATPDQAALSTGKTSAAARNAPRSTVVGRSRADEAYRQRREPWNTEEYALIRENGFLAAHSNPLSTFGIDVDKASYANTRRFLLSGQRPPIDAVRIEELVNYFPYDYPEPRERAPFSILTDVAPSPWNPDHQLVRIALQGARSQQQTLPPSNLVFLIDVSGSMQSPDKLPLVKASFRELVRGLRPQDRVAIVVYAGSAGLVLPSTDGEQPRAILDAINRLEAGGSTAGGAGIRLAYAVARQHFLPRGNNRVILATDGDFNVGTSSESELVRLIEQEGKGGIHLTVLGFGTGNYKDSRMESLADKGDGNYAYIDGPLEAQKVFGTELTGTLFTIAKDVKIQVEFNPGRVRAYRLIGYENRLLAAEDFNDDRKDAGELGAGHSVTALYEIVPVHSRSVVQTGDVDPLKYQPVRSTFAASRGELLTVKLRYQPPMGGTSQLIERSVTDRDVHDAVLGEFAFATAVAGYGMLLRDSEFKGNLTWDTVRRLGQRGLGRDPNGFRAEFLRLVDLAAGGDAVAARE